MDDKQPLSDTVASIDGQSSAEQLEESVTDTKIDNYEDNNTLDWLYKVVGRALKSQLKSLEEYHKIMLPDTKLHSKAADEKPLIQQLSSLMETDISVNAVMLQSNWSLESRKSLEKVTTSKQPCFSSDEQQPGEHLPIKRPAMSLLVGKINEEHFTNLRLATFSAMVEKSEQSCFVFPFLTSLLTKLGFFYDSVQQKLRCFECYIIYDMNSIVVRVSAEIGDIRKLNRRGLLKSWLIMVRHLEQCHRPNCKFFPCSKMTSTKLPEQKKDQETQQSVAKTSNVQVEDALLSKSLVSKFSEDVKLVYYLQPKDRTLLNGIDELQKLAKVIKYERRVNDAVGKEAQVYSSLFKRWQSFNQKQAKTLVSSKLALMLAAAGFYFSSSADNSNKVRCSFCKRSKLLWWKPITKSGVRLGKFSFEDDVKKANALVCWHRSKSHTCPITLDLRADNIAPKENEIEEIRIVQQSSDIIPKAKLTICYEHGADVEVVSNFSDEDTSEQMEKLSQEEPCENVFSRRVRLMQKDMLFPEFISINTRLQTFNCTLDPHASSATQEDQMLNDQFYICDVLLQYESTGQLTVGNSCWPADKPNPQLLAQAGFFTAGEDDQVICYCCGIVLCCWQSHDDPWVEHAYFSPDCAEVLANRGEQYVKSVQRFAKNPELCGTVFPIAGYIGRLKGSVYIARERESRARMATALTRQICEDLNVDELIGQYPIEQNLLLFNDDFCSNLDYYDAVKHLQTLVALSGLSDFVGVIQHCKQRTHIVAEQIKLNSYEANNSEVSLTDYNSSAVRHLERLSMQSIHPEQLCRNCADAKITTSFLPCKHASVCKVCASKLNSCPICQQAIKNTILHC